MASEEASRRPRGPVDRRPEQGDAGESPTSGDGLIAKATRQAPPWLISAIVHMIALIALGLIFFSPRVNQTVVIEAVAYAEKLGEQLEFDSPLAGNDDEKVEDPVLTPEKRLINFIIIHFFSAMNL